MRKFRRTDDGWDYVYTPGSAEPFEVPSVLTATTELFRPSTLEFSEESLTIRGLFWTMRLRWEWVDTFIEDRYPPTPFGVELFLGPQRVKLRLTAAGRRRVEKPLVVHLFTKSVGRDIFLPSISCFGQSSYTELADRLNATLAERRQAGGPGGGGA